MKPSHALVLALGLVGCAPAAVPIEEAMFAAKLGVDLSASTKLDSGLYVRELEVGTGTEVKNGKLVTARYTGWLTDGTEFDSNQDRGFRFSVGAGDVISGWDLGVVGMKVGGTRQLIVPPSLGYGESGYGPIPGNAILVFTVTIIGVM